MFVPPSCIDTLYDYIPLLERDYLCKVPKEKIGMEVAIIGSGAAGIVAAHELLKIGLKPVIYEANSRMGGRLYSKTFEQIQDPIKPFGELGAMRIPPASRIFLHYAKKLNLTLGTNFPRAGYVKTAIYYKNKIYPWKMNAEPPSPFSEIKHLWEFFCQGLIAPIHTAWSEGNLDLVKELWQIHINQFNQKGIYQVLREFSPLKNQDQIESFGTLGTGHAGFNPLFHVSFLELLRILVNSYMDNHFLILEGMSEFINQLYHLRVKSPLGELSLADINAVQLNSPVVLMDYNMMTRNPVIITKDKNKQYQRKEYPAVIFTGSMSAAHLINLTNKTESGIFLMKSEVREAIKNSPMLAYSKTFICTQDKFWLDKEFPACILSDDITRTSYFLDYPATTHGVICLSYSFGMDAMKLHAVDPLDRVTIFKRSLSAGFPEMVKYIVPLNNEVVNVDWINEKYINGAFKILTPGNDENQKSLYFQFQSCLTDCDKGVYFAGDTISWSGGWAEGALYTAINSVFAVAKRLGAKIINHSPLKQNPDLYHY